MNNIPKNVCLAPFTSISISPIGNIRPCCLYFENSERLNEHVIKWETSDILKSRNTFLNNEFPSGCFSCENYEKVGNTSLRINYNSKFSTENTIKYLNDPHLISGDIQFGRLCNLSCLMCRPVYSTHLETTMRNSVEQHNISNNLKTLYTKYINYIDDSDWTLNEKTYVSVLDICKTLYSIKIDGGEIFIHPKIKHFLTTLLENEKTKNLSITTNLTYIDDEIINLLNKFEQLNIRFSFEGIEKLDEFIRYPTMWNKKIENFKTVKNMLPKAKLSITTVIQGLNVNKLETILNYNVFDGLSKNFHLAIPELNLMSINHCDNDYLNYVIDKYSNNEFIFKHIKHSIKSALSFNKKLTIEMLEHIKERSNLININIGEINNEFYDYHKKYNIL